MVCMLAEGGVEGGALVHTWRWGEPNHGPAEILTNGEEWGMGAVPGVTHLKTSKKAFHSSDTSAPHLIIKKTKQNKKPHVLLLFFCSEPKAGLKTNDEACSCPDFRFNCLYNKKLDSHPSHFLTAAVGFFCGLLSFSIVQRAMKPQQCDTPFLPL